MRLATTMSAADVAGFPVLNRQTQEAFQVQQTSSRSSHCRANNNHAMDARFSCNICLDAVSEPVVTQCGHLYCWPCLYKWLEPGMYTCERARLTGMATSSRIPPDSSRRVCPVCKAPCSVSAIVPIYVRTDTSASSPTRTATRTNTPSAAREEMQFNSSLNQSSDTDDELSVHMSDESGPQEDESIEVSMGLRQRRSNSTTGSEESSEVPRRPAANSPAPTSPTQTTAMVSNNSIPHSPPSATLATGMLPLIQEAMRRAGRQDAFVPVIHRPEGFNPSANHSSDNNNMPLESDPGATEFLSRLLLMLGSFVIMCLLLF